MEDTRIAAKQSGSEKAESLWWSGAQFRGGDLRVDYDDGGLVAIRKPPGATPLDAIECANKALAAWGEDGGAEEPALLMPVESFLRRCSSRPIQGWSVAARSQEAADELVRRIDEVSGTFMAVVNEVPLRADGRDAEEGSDVPRVSVTSSHGTRNTTSGLLHLVKIECPRLARDGVAMKSILQKQYGCSVVGGRANNVVPIKGLGGKGARTFLGMVRLSLPGVLGRGDVQVEQEIPLRYSKMLERQERAFDEWRERGGGENYDSESNTDPSTSNLVPSVSFCGHNFRIPAGVFSPRTGSEALVMAAVESLPLGRESRVLDLGSGSGSLLLSLLLDKSGSSSTGVGVDFSPEAVDAARANAATLGIGSDRVAFVVGDFLTSDLPLIVQNAMSGVSSSSSKTSESFDVVVCNPPYLDPGNLPPSFVANEEKLQSPAAALFAGERGLDVYRAFSGHGGFANQWMEAGLVNAGSILVLEVPSGGSRIIEIVEGMFVAANQEEESNDCVTRPALMESLGIRRDGRNARRCIVFRWL
uniref:Methyltransferase domain-containing protein n=1 Tax=Odontella aurita TaxID=265563 RepID=A0A7S4IZ69_9STRA|mmetsp:Transcript_3352/g.8681  ORF Transcript_3352/g.8681 Transcript_3352/m.8681 type:complete len:531 (+) Transcript_3352:119-1711(+)